MTPEQVETEIDTFPVTAMAAMMGSSETKIRGLLRRAITNAEGCNIYNMRKVADVALRQFSRPR